MTYRTLVIGLGLGLLIGGAYVVFRHVPAPIESQPVSKEDVVSSTTTSPTPPSVPGQQKLAAQTTASPVDTTPRVTVESVSELQVRIAYANLPVGTDLRIIGVLGSPSSLPVTSTFLKATPGAYTGNSVWERSTDRTSATLTASLPASTEYGSYVLEVSDPNSGWRTFIRTSAFLLGASQVAQKPTCWMTATPTTVKAGETFTLKWGSTGAEYALTPSGAKVPPQQEQKVGTSFPETFSEKLRFVGRGGEISCSVSVDVR